MILVTGGTGLVGSHLLYELVNRGEKVKALVRNNGKIELVAKVFSYYADNSKELIEKIEWVSGDLLDLYSLNRAFEEVEKVYHCAAIVAIGGNNKNELIEANVIGTENVVNLCIDHKIKKLCHVSSVAALGNAVNGHFVTEDSKWSSAKGRSVYSISKFKAEMEVWRGIQEGLNAVIVNPSVIIGPGFWNSGSGSLFTKAAKGMKYYTSGSTGFVDVRDVVDCMIQLMESEMSQERFVINAENFSYKDLFTSISKAVGVKAPRKEATEKILKLAVLLDSFASTMGLKKREITKEIVKSGVSKTEYANNKIKEALGKSFIPINKSIEETAKKLKIK